MMESGAGEDETVDVSDCDTNRHAFAEGLEHAAGSAAVQVKSVSGAAKIRGDDVGLAVDTEADVADKSGVQDFVDGFTVVLTALGQAFDLGALGGLKLAHLPILAGRGWRARANLAPVGAVSLLSYNKREGHKCDPIGPNAIGQECSVSVAQ
jgi:hypothetical protein